MKLTKEDKLEVWNHCLFVNGKPFVVDHLDEPIFGVDENGNLMTLFRWNLMNHWSPDSIEGYFA